MDQRLRWKHRGVDDFTGRFSDRDAILLKSDPDRVEVAQVVIRFRIGDLHAHRTGGTKGHSTDVQERLSVVPDKPGRQVGPFGRLGDIGEVKGSIVHEKIEVVEAQPSDRGIGIRGNRSGHHRAGSGPQELEDEKR